MRIKGKNKRRIILACIGCSVFFLYGLWYLFTHIGLKTSQHVETSSTKSPEPLPYVTQAPISSATQSKPEEHLKGRWRAARDAGQDQNGLEDELDKLFSLPYLQGYKKAPLEQNVTVYDGNLAYEGLNLYSSGHAAEAGIMDMRGNILHRWTYNIEQNRELMRNVEFSTYESRTHWRRVHLYENGDILAIYEGIGMIKLDKDSNLLWHLADRKTHHHMQVGDKGNIYVLTAKLKIIPRINKDEPVLEDFITILSPDGKVIEEHSLLESFENSSYAHILAKLRNQGELFHTNTLQLLDGKLSHISPLFKKGNVLISVLYINTTAIVDLEKNQVVWALDGYENGLWDGMHEPVLLKNGNILIFDNDWGKGDYGESKVIEFNPFTKKIVWQYKGGKEHPFYSKTCGTNQRLPNGNTLITESDSGRAFEVTRDGKIVWEYLNPHRAGENNELIATLLHVHRIDRDSLKWLVLEEQR